MYVFAVYHLEEREDEDEEEEEEKKKKNRRMYVRHAGVVAVKLTRREHSMQFRTIVFILPSKRREIFPL